MFFNSLVHNIIDLKTDIHLFLEKNRDAVDENCEISQNLMEEARNLDAMIMKSMPVLEERLKYNMELVEQYLESKDRKISEMSKCLNLVLSLTSLNVDMEKYKQLMSENSIRKAYLLLMQMETFVEAMKTAEFQNIDIFDSFQVILFTNMEFIFQSIITLSI